LVHERMQQAPQTPPKQQEMKGGEASCVAPNPLDERERAMLEELAQEIFDVVIVGTGLTESILSAALALQGKKVLHVDEHEYYGGEQATLTVNQVQQWAEEQGQARGRESEGKDTTKVCAASQVNIRVLDESLWALAQPVLRSFNLDLSAHAVLCRGPMVEALVRSGTAKHLEFKPLEDILMLDKDDLLLRVPCSKAAVFKSKDISMAEKRHLMRFLQHCMDQSTVQDGTKALETRNEASLNQGRALARPQNKADRGYASGSSDQDMTDFLTTTCNLSPKLARSILYALAFLPREPGPGELNMEAGMKLVQRHLGGLGRFGNTAFLCPVYGISEVGQAFCRLSSVYGSIFILRHAPERVVTEPESGETVGVRFGEDILVRAPVVIAGSSASERVESHLPQANTSQMVILRRVMIANGPVVSFAKSDASMKEATAKKLLSACAMEGSEVPRRLAADPARCVLVVPPHHVDIANPNTIVALQVDHGVAASAPGYFVVHLTMECPKEEAEVGQAVLSRMVENLVARAHKNVTLARELAGSDASTSVSFLWEVAFSQPLGAARDIDGAFTVPTPGVCFDLTSYVQNAERLFKEFCPGEEFLTSPTPAHEAEDENDQVQALLEHARMPVTTDLTWFEYLGGIVQ